MRNSSLYIFLAIVLSVYGLINFYILRRGWQALSGTGIFRNVTFGIFLFLILCYPFARFTERLISDGVVNVFLYIGSLYVALMVYLLLLIFLVDILRLVNVFINFFPAVVRNNSQIAALVSFFVVLGTALIIVTVGYINALNPRLRILDLTINKPAGNVQALNIVVASDIHLGRIVGNGRLEKFVNIINELKPDLVLFPGDIVDEDAGPAAGQNMVATLQKVKAPYGVFSVTGNHEYYGGIQKNLEFLRKGNVTVLQDASIKIADAFYLIGRRDRNALRFGEKRKSLGELLQDVDARYPLILMDHQPLHLEEAELNGIDIQLSGHTHNGQIFPFNLINKPFYEMNWGYLRKGKTQYYVSSGVGTWGPPVRTANVPEVVQIRISFNKQAKF